MIADILKAMTCYATGQLASLKSEELRLMQDAMIEKIDGLERIAKHHVLGPELLGDLRKYRLIRETIAVELESRANVAVRDFTASL